MRVMCGVWGSLIAGQIGNFSWDLRMLPKYNLNEASIGQGRVVNIRWLSKSFLPKSVQRTKSFS